MANSGQILKILFKTLEDVDYISLSKLKSILKIEFEIDMSNKQALILNSQIKFSDSVRQAYSRTGETIYVKLQKDEESE